MRKQPSMRMRSPCGPVKARRLRWSLYAVAAAFAVASGVTYLTYQDRAAQARTASATATRVEHNIFDKQSLPDLCAFQDFCVGSDGRIFSVVRYGPDDRVVGISVGYGLDCRIVYAALDAGAVQILCFGPGGHLVHVVRVGPDGRVAERVRADAATTAARTAKTVLVALAAGTALIALTGLAWTVVGKRGGYRLAARQHACDGWAAEGACPQGAWAEGMATGLIAAAARAVGAAEDQARYAEEWSADLAELPAGWRRLGYALTVRLLAPRGIRAARQTVPSASPPH